MTAVLGPISVSADLESGKGGGGLGPVMELGDLGPLMARGDQRQEKKRAERSRIEDKVGMAGIPEIRRQGRNHLTKTKLREKGRYSNRGI